MAKPVRRTMNHTGGRRKPVPKGFGFSLLARLTASTSRDRSTRVGDQRGGVEPPRLLDRLSTTHAETVDRTSSCVLTFLQLPQMTLSSPGSSGKNSALLARELTS